ncbi:hypothetical protein [Marisediminicola sp. LYQ134]|uniref:hypothetical protein n=1 Tax=Marisediminicola sp. LYQ134 TaxID=3391061 RepID=UPI003982DFB3
MQPRTVAVIGALTIALGFIVAQLLTAAAGAVSLYGGTQLDQTLLAVVFSLGGLVTDVAVPLGSAMVGVGAALHFTRRQHEHA